MNTKNCLNDPIPLNKLLSYSVFLRRCHNRYPPLIEGLFENYPDISLYISPKDGQYPIKKRFLNSLMEVLYFIGIEPSCSGLEASPPPLFKKAIRVFRAKEMARIALIDLGGISDTLLILKEISILAEFIIDLSINYAYSQIANKYGLSKETTWHRAGLVVFGMGKLGGGELNFSSDIDLIFGFSPNNKMMPKEFWQKVCRELLNILGSKTEDGICFRVDMRLRPFGDNGPLCMSLQQMEDYYEIHGREWERYAMIKARPICGAIEAGYAFLSHLRPFIYRKYLDYSAIDAIRQMKTLIEKEAQKKALLRNIKLGQGGIREIEFLVQAIQLIHGGRRPELRTQSTISAIQAINSLNLLNKTVCNDLINDYIFLRKLENALQEREDQQTHNMPTDCNSLKKLSEITGHCDENALLAHINTVTTRVHSNFNALFFSGNASDADNDPKEEIAAMLKGALSEEAAFSLLKGLGYKEPAETLKGIASLLTSPMARAMTEKTYCFLERLIIEAIPLASKLKHPDTAILRLLSVLEGIGRRGFYLAMLSENKAILENALRLAADAKWIAMYLARHPAMLECLISPEPFEKGVLNAKEQMSEQLKSEILKNNPADHEAFLDTLRYFKHNIVFQLAFLGIEKGMSAISITSQNTMLAEILLEEAANEAKRYIERRFDIKLSLDDFLIVGYGKFGSKELAFSSDLDLVFIYNDLNKSCDPNKNQYIISRLGQRLIHNITTLTQAGRLYEVDMRLRPDGASGVLVTPLLGFRDYQKKEAWTWEHQALVRARGVYGSEAIKKGFQDIRAEILTVKRDKKSLKQQIIDMRYRLLRYKSRSKAIKKYGTYSKNENFSMGDGRIFHIKNDEGGMTDIEFFVQYHYLINCSQYPQLLYETSTAALLSIMGDIGILKTDIATGLKEAYNTYLGLSNKQFLEEKGMELPLTQELKEIRDFVRQNTLKAI